MGEYREIMNSFTVENIPDLDTCVLAALELFLDQKLPQIEVPYTRPLVVGSGNAAATGRIMFAKHDAIFADESTFEEKLRSISSIDGVVLISASGEKHAPIIAKRAKELGKKVMLLTTNQNASARDFADDVFVFPKNREPYTYNTSTYLGMILSITQENVQEILDFIRTRIDTLDFSRLKEFEKYFLVIPSDLSGVIRMLHVKFIELFGRRIARDIETTENMKHAVTVVPSDELFISFGSTDRWSENQLIISLPDNCRYGAMMVIGYYVIGKIQRAHPAWFKENIVTYCKKSSLFFGKEINPIVE